MLAGQQQQQPLYQSMYQHHTQPYHHHQLKRAPSPSPPEQPASDSASIAIASTSFAPAAKGEGWPLDESRWPAAAAGDSAAANMSELLSAGAFGGERAVTSASSPSLPSAASPTHLTTAATQEEEDEDSFFALERARRAKRRKQRHEHQQGADLEPALANLSLLHSSPLLHHQQQGLAPPPTSPSQLPTTASSSNAALAVPILPGPPPSSPISRSLDNHGSHIDPAALPWQSHSVAPPTSPTAPTATSSSAAAIANVSSSLALMSDAPTLQLPPPSTTSLAGEQLDGALASLAQRQARRESLVREPDSPSSHRAQASSATADKKPRSKGGDVKMHGSTSFDKAPDIVYIESLDDTDSEPEQRHDDDDDDDDEGHGLGGQERLDVERYARSLFYDGDEEDEDGMSLDRPHHLREHRAGGAGGRARSLSGGRAGQLELHAALARSLARERASFATGGPSNDASSASELARLLRREKARDANALVLYKPLLPTVLTAREEDEDERKGESAVQSDDEDDDELVRAARGAHQNRFQHHHHGHSSASDESAAKQHLQQPSFSWDQPLQRPQTLSRKRTADDVDDMEMDLDA